jgi:membrane-bound lytic murein transglycosylase B
MPPASSTRDHWPWWNCKTATRHRCTWPARKTFYAITRYNWSSYYALAVIELAQEVTAAMPK